MAKMDQRLPLTEGTNRVIEDPVPVSPIKAAVDFATEALGGYVQLRDDMQKEAARKKKADDEARQSQIAFEVSQSPERASEAVATTRQQFLASLEPVTPPVEETPSLVNPDPVFSVGEDGTITSSPALRQEVSVAAQRAANFKAAEEQGRIPSITFNSAMNADFRRLRDKYPDQVPFIIKMYKDMGIDANLFTEAKDAQDEHEFERERGQKRIEESESRDETYIKSAEEAYGTETLTWSRERKVVEGMRVVQSAFELKQTGEKYRLLKEQRDLDDSTRKATEDQINKEFESRLISGSFNASQPFIQSMGKLVEGLNTNPSDPEFIQRFQAMAPEAKLGVERYISSALATAKQEGYTGSLETLEKSLRQQWQPILDIFQGDFSVVSNKITALKSIETSMKIDTATALPLYTALTTSGFDVKNLPAIMKGMETDTDLMNALNNELKGYRQDLLSDGGSTRFRRIIEILRGQDSLARAKPGNLVKELPSLVNSTKQLATEYIRKPKDIDGNLVINGVGEITTQLRGLPTNNTNVLAQATLSFATPEHRKALVQSLNDGNVDHSMAQATVQASRAGSALLLNYFDKNVGEVNKLSENFKVVWDSDNGKYKLWKKAVPSRITVTGRQGMDMSRPNPAFNAPPPTEMTRFIKAANINLDNAVELGKSDPTTPKGTDVQLRNWYGKQRPLPTEKKAAPIDPDKELKTMFEKAEASLDQLREDVTSRRISIPNGPGARTEVSKKGVEISVPAVSDLEEVHGNNPIYQSFKSEAAANGIPEEVAVRLGWVEGKFRNQGVNSAGASGPAQVRGFNPKTGKPVHDTESLELFGKRVKDLTPQENIKFGMMLLKRYWDQTGDLRTAVKRYLGAEKGDENLTGEQYANLIF